jgi:hypothetical protein
MKTHTIVALIFFLVGSGMHTLFQVDAIARSKNNPNNSRLAILRDRWPTILNRAAWSMGFFALWLQGQLVALLNAIHIPLPAAALAVLDLHLGAALSWMAGYMSDSALAFIPGLTTSIPPAIQQPGPPSAPTA